MVYSECFESIPGILMSRGSFDLAEKENFLYRQLSNLVSISIIGGGG